VLLDLMIPQIGGIEVCRRIRKTSDVPIMMVTARVEEADRLTGLEIGADDYVVKPFSPREVVARVKAILRRVRPQTAGVPIRHLDFEVDLERHQVRCRGVAVPLTALEFRLFQTLVAALGRVFSRDALLSNIYPTGDVNVLDRTIDVHIKNLRQKIEAHPTRPRYIKTVRGVGYQFAES
jgi:DNA-binding response OmpR family regulator